MGKGSMMIAALAVILACAPGAEAASFTSAPPTYMKPTDGPFSYGFQSGQQRSDPYGWVAYKLPGETAWHRCQPVMTASVASLPPGVYEAQVADDINYDNWISRGLGATASSYCSSPDPMYPVTTRQLVVDGTPPQIPIPTVRTAGRTVQLTTGASDDLSGVASLSWSFGDGGERAGNLVTYTYFAGGVYNARVTATDRSGNSASLPFSITVSSGTVSGGSTPNNSSAPDLTIKSGDLVGYVRSMIGKKTTGQVRRLRRDCSIPSQTLALCYLSWRIGKYRFAGNARYRHFQQNGDVSWSYSFKGSRKRANCGRCFVKRLRW